MSDKTLIVRKPIFIIGVGRSGSSIFHEIMCEHPEIAWLSDLCEKYPGNPKKNRNLMKLIDFPILGNLVKMRHLPSESYKFWNLLYKGFATPVRDLKAEDVTNTAKEKIQNKLSAILTKKRNRLLIKITGWPRVCFLKKILRLKINYHREVSRKISETMMIENINQNWRFNAG